MKEDKLAMNNLTLEVSDKYNIGLEMRLFKRLNLSVDAYMDKKEQNAGKRRNVFFRHRYQYPATEQR